MLFIRVMLHCALLGGSSSKTLHRARPLPVAWCHILRLNLVPTEFHLLFFFLSESYTMFGALSLPLVDASLYSYASCIGRSQASSSSLRSILLAECRPRRRHLHKQVQPVGSSLLRRSYTSGSDDSQSSSTSSQDTSATTVSSSSSGESPSRPTDGSSSSNSPPTSPATSSTSQPASPIFQFLLSVSFLGKPAHPDDPKSFASTFSSNSPIKRWRDAQLQQHGRGWKGKGKARAPDAGDDFWFLEKRSNGETNYHGITSDSAVFGVADGEAESLFMLRIFLRRSFLPLT